MVSNVDGVTDSAPVTSHSGTPNVDVAFCHYRVPQLPRHHIGVEEREGLCCSAQGQMWGWMVQQLLKVRRQIWFWLWTMLPPLQIGKYVMALDCFRWIKAHESMQKSHRLTRINTDIASVERVPVLVRVQAQAPILGMSTRLMAWMSFLWPAGKTRLTTKRSFFVLLFIIIITFFYFYFFAL